MSDIPVYNADKGRYELAIDGHIVFGNVRRDGNTLYIDYVEAPQALRGTGAGDAFMKGMVQILRAQNMKVIPLCGYASAWINRRAEHKDLLA